ncbi:DUF3613 domain-containing protein [Dyella tabacisoli]|uniref:DUF3613 domain-containing protein n=1 Tax=Dyella tabacisoli TaxID=2282381 RepID=A0A369UKN8_9GAMM|nr:DUF3613 domain-containing protein [Dyella tabacisoli]RDD81324.1 DUF3613 domain-containing protein [Dyella tabacisoli]
MNTPALRINIIALALALSVPALVHAQQAAADTGTSPAPQDPSAKTYYAAQVGDTTRHLLQLQADGTQAGKHLPMLGDEASASYRRYLKSFEHPIPEYYQTTVGKNSNNGR